jgi:hypothetical protein
MIRHRHAVDEPAPAARAMVQPARVPSQRPTRESRLVEWALLIFGALIMSGPPRLRTRELDAALESPLSLDPAALLQVVAWLGAGAVVVYLLGRDQLRRGGMLRALSREPSISWYLIFGVLGLFSAAWSPSPPYTVFFAGKLIVATLAIILMGRYGRHASIDRALRVLFLVYAAKLAALILLFLIRPELTYQADYQGRALTLPRVNGGVVLEDYGISPLFAGLWLLTIAIFGSNRVRRNLALLGYGVTWVFLLLSQTRTSIFMGLAFLVIMVSLRRSSRVSAVLLTTAAAGLGLTVMWRYAEAVLRIATREGEGVSTLSGRTEAYAFLIQRWKVSPIIGSGYGAGTRSALIDFVKATGLGIGAGHDVLSTTLVDLGLIGAAILAIVFVMTWRQVIVLWRQANRLPDQHRVIVAHLTCLAIYTTITCIVGQGIAAVAPPFLVLTATAWMLRQTLQSRAHSVTPIIAARALETNTGHPSRNGVPSQPARSSGRRPPT